ncbi:MAG: pirin family protein [Burkholderiaceae bacterium]|nr:pirin family protein [Roseateles sp.]MBV8469550.1 pirin family protein [Burkholderiaceae bacterium]
MFELIPMQKMQHGPQFRALTLRIPYEFQMPLLGVDHAWMSGPTFGPHPHKGLSAVSYLFHDAETSVRNQDSIGNDNLIPPGGLHWMAAGRGVVHEEVPAEIGKTVHSLQIFVALPAALSSGEPFALSLSPDKVPVVSLPRAEVRVVLGRFHDQHSPLDAPTPMDMLDIRLEPGAELELTRGRGAGALLLPIHGAVKLDGHAFSAEGPMAPLFPADASTEVMRLQATDEAVHVVVFVVPPLSA